MLRLMILITATTLAATLPPFSNDVKTMIDVGFKVGSVVIVLLILCRNGGIDESL